jgi:hypothetical protein
VRPPGSEKSKVLNYDQFLDLPEINNYFRTYNDIEFWSNHRDTLKIFKGFTVEIDKDLIIDVSLIQPWLDHALNIICSGNELYYKTLIKWCAWNYQNLNSHCDFAVVLLGEEGIGKNTFTNVLCDICGTDYSERCLNDINQVVGNNARSTLSYKKFVVCNECVDVEKSKANWDTFKTRITEDFIKLRDLYETPQTVRNVNNYILLSNHYNSIKLGADDRRYFILEISDKYAEIKDGKPNPPKNIF